MDWIQKCKVSKSTVMRLKNWKKCFGVTIYRCKSYKDIYIYNIDRLLRYTEWHKTWIVHCWNNRVQSVWFFLSWEPPIHNIDYWLLCDHRGHCFSALSAILNSLNLPPMVFSYFLEFKFGCGKPDINKHTGFRKWLKIHHVDCFVGVYLF